MTVFWVWPAPGHRQHYNKFQPYFEEAKAHILGRGVTLPKAGNWRAEAGFCRRRRRKREIFPIGSGNFSPLLYNLKFAPLSANKNFRPEKARETGIAARKWADAQRRQKTSPGRASILGEAGFRHYYNKMQLAADIGLTRKGGIFQTAGWI
jgi:hypothetical protein